MTTYTATIRLDDCDEKGPRNERVKLAQAFIRRHLPEIHVAINAHLGAMTLRTTGNPDLLRVAISCANQCGALRKDHLTYRF